MLNIADVAKIIEVEKNTVKKWCYLFEDYLSSDAIVKGKPKHFNETDLRVFALISMHWEDDPDIDHIKTALNQEDQNTDELVEFSLLNTSVFRESVECDYTGEEAWTKGILLGGMASKTHQIEVARSYKNAADELVECVRKSSEPYDLAYPIFFLYRHSLELYLKVIVLYKPDKDKERHYIDKLINKIELKHGEKMPQWIRDRLFDFHKIDPFSTTFRYLEGINHEKIENDEIRIDFNHLQFVMNKLCKIFEGVINKLKLY